MNFKYPFPMSRLIAVASLCIIASASWFCGPSSVDLGGLGYKALIITTSHGVLGDTGKDTGVYGEEFTAPFYMFSDSGLNVTIVSIRGGDIPVEPMSFGFMATNWDLRYMSDPSAMRRLENSPSISQIDWDEYDIVFMAGGWGAAWDLRECGSYVTRAFSRGQLLGSVCHGVLGFLDATKPNGRPLVEGMEITGVTDSQITQLGVKQYTPLHPETELLKRGANFKASRGYLTDLLRSLVVVDGNVITGQNQNSACDTSEKLLQALNDRHIKGYNTLV